MIGRRAALQAIGLGALAVPAAAREIKGNILGGYPPQAGYAVAGQPGMCPPEASLPSWQRARRAFADKDTLAAIRSSLFEQNRNISVLDIDLATKRSFSLAAKVAYQRQRLVEAELASMTVDGWSNHAWSIIEKFLGGR